MEDDKDRKSDAEKNEDGGGTSRSSPRTGGSDSKDGPGTNGVHSKSSSSSSVDLDSESFYADEEDNAEEWHTTKERRRVVDQTQADERLLGESLGGAATDSPSDWTESKLQFGRKMTGGGNEASLTSPSESKSLESQFQADSSSERMSVSGIPVPDRHSVTPGAFQEQPQRNGISVTPILDGLFDPTNASQVHRRHTEAGGESIGPQSSTPLFPSPWLGSVERSVQPPAIDGQSMRHVLNNIIGEVEDNSRRETGEGSTTDGSSTESSAVHNCCACPVESDAPHECCACPAEFGVPTNFDEFDSVESSHIPNLTDSDALESDVVPRLADSDALESDVVSRLAGSGAAQSPAESGSIPRLAYSGAVPHRANFRAVESDTTPRLAASDNRESDAAPRLAEFDTADSGAIRRLAESATAEEKTTARPAKSRKGNSRLRCDMCSKRLGLTSIQCRCGRWHCAQHRYPGEHGCTFDYRAMGAQEIRRNNPRVVADKVRKI